MKKFFLTIVLAAISFAAAFAQQRYEWSNGTSFELPAGCSIVENSTQKFVAQSSDGNFAFSIVPISYQEVTGEEIGEVLGNLAFNEMGMSAEEDDYSVEDLEVTNGKGIYVIGIDGDGTPCIASVIFSELSQTACFIFEAFDSSYSTTAGEVLGSIIFK